MSINIINLTKEIYFKYTGLDFPLSIEFDECKRLGFVEFLNGKPTGFGYSFNLLELPEHQQEITVCHELAHFITLEVKHTKKWEHVFKDLYGKELFLNNKSNSDIIYLMTDEWYVSMTDLEKRKRRLSQIFNRIGDDYNNKSIVDLGSGDGTAMVALSDIFSKVTGYELRDVKSRLPYIKKNIIEDWHTKFDYAYANVLMYFSEDELNQLFKNNKSNFDVMVVTYRFDWWNTDEAKINNMTQKYFQELVSKYGFKTEILDPATCKLTKIQ